VAAGCPVAPVAGSSADAAASEVATALGLRPERIQVLDRRDLALAFVEGDYEIYTIRDLVTGEPQDVALDERTGARVDAEALRARDRELAADRGVKLAPDLRELLLRHPELPAIEVEATFDPGAGAAGPKRRQLEAELARLGIAASPVAVDNGWALRASLSARQVARLAQLEPVRSVELLADPVILDR